METPSSQTPQQPQQQAKAEPHQQQQQPQQQASSSKNLKNWFEEFKARVSKKNPTSQASGSDQVSALVNEDDANKTVKEAPSATQPKSKSSSLRSRRPAKVPIIESPDFDTASINTIFNRRDSRYDLGPRRSRKTLLSKVGAPIKWLICYLIPFNYTLPWKLLCILNTSFVIIVIGLVSGSTDTPTVLNFSNGFICGLLVGLACFIIIVISFVVSILPKPQDDRSSSAQCDNLTKPTLVSSVNDDTLRSLDTNASIERELSSMKWGQKMDDFTGFEFLVPENDQTADDLEEGGPLVDDDYKGWMIEFIGDYELRNTSDIKLKSIFVRIEGGVLYLCKAKNSHDAESSILPVFTSQRVYDLNNAQKFSANLLIPKNVRNKQKYVWSKKYPIKLEFRGEEYVDGKSTTGDDTKETQLTLFARSCREKEEWFRRFKQIVEGNRLVQGSLKHRRSGQSTDSNDNSLRASLRRSRCQSPSGVKRDQVQTSRSSHLLTEAKKQVEDEDKFSEARDSPSPGLTRTKSCDLLHASQCPSINGDEIEQGEGPELSSGAADESTLTKETAEMFSQAIEYSNLLESQPTIDYEEYIERLIRSGQNATQTSDWFNSLTGRIFFDVFSQNYWSLWFKRKIQRKLYRIRLPYFMETLTLSQIDLGTNAPQFFNVVSHKFDSFGLSIDFDMSYSGGLTMTFATKLNLLKIKSDNSTNTTTAAASPSSATCGSNSTQTQSVESNVPKDGSSTSESSLDNIGREKPSMSSSASTRTSVESSDSEDDDSDSSSDSSIGEADSNEISDWEEYGAEKTRQNIVKFVDKIASSRYFQQATENRYIKKKLQDISNCPLVLVVQIQSLNGVLTINVPPPQTDRIWYGFKPTPELVLKAIPKMGDREVSLSHVTDWIERKLSEEFRKILVIPNMEDIVLPVLKSDYIQYVTATR